MKKILFFFLLIFILCGCSRVENVNINDILAFISTDANKPNMYRTGFKYYLPRDMKIEETKLFNDVISNGNSVFYLYVDAVSYYNKVKIDYKVNKDSFYSNKISYNGLDGYLEINLLENEKYLIEIMYNYAKIEVIVDKEDINISLLNAINILKSIEMNDNIVASLLSSDVFNYDEEEFNIFHTTSSDSPYIQRDDTYVPEENEVPDTDLLN